MSSFADCPLEIIEEIISKLQDDLDALKACSQACLSLLPLCRKFIFRSIHLSSTSKFGLLLDNNPRISDHVQKLSYYISPYHLKDGDVPVLERLHRVDTFRLKGYVSWNAIPTRVRDTFLRLIQSRCLTRLELRDFMDFPISVFLPCVNLTDLTLSSVDSGYGPVVQCYKREASTLEAAVPQLQSFAFNYRSDRYVMGLLHAKRYNDVPILDFRHIRTLSVEVRESGDLDVTCALVGRTAKLETLEYNVNGLRNGCVGLATWMNRSSLSTLKKLSFQFYTRIGDPLCGLCKELGILAGLNVVEELEIIVRIDYECELGKDWDRLDAVLADGFPMLRHVSLNIRVYARGYLPPSYDPETELETFTEDYFPQLSTNTIVTFDFSSTVKWVG